MNREEKCIDQKSLSISDLQIDDLNLDNSVRNNEKANFAQPRCSNCGGSYQNENYLRKRERINSIRNHPSIQATLIIITMNVTDGHQICASDVYQRIILSQIV